MGGRRKRRDCRDQTKTDESAQHHGPEIARARADWCEDARSGTYARRATDGLQGDGAGPGQSVCLLRRGRSHVKNEREPTGKPRQFLGQQVFSQVVNRVKERDPALERHSTGAGDFMAIAVRCSRVTPLTSHSDAMRGARRPRREGPAGQGDRLGSNRSNANAA